MTRLFLAAGVATLAIAVPATAGPPDHGDKNKNEAQVERQSAEGKHAPAAQKQQQQAIARAQRQAPAAPPIERQQQRVTANERPQRPADVQLRTKPQQVQTRIAQQQQLRAGRQEEVQARVAEQQQLRAERQQQIQKRMAQQQQIRTNRQQEQTGIAERQQIQANRQHQADTRLAQQQQMRVKRQQQAQTRVVQQQQVRANNLEQAQNMRAKLQQQTKARVVQQQQVRAEQAQQVRTNRIQQAQARTAQQQQMRMKQQQVQAQIAEQQQIRANRQQQIQREAAQQQVRANNANAMVVSNRGVGYGVGGCPPGLVGKNCMPPGQAAKLGVAATVPVITARNAVALRSGRVDELNARLGTRVVAPMAATSLIGAPVTTAPSVLGMTLNPVPQPISYLYPTTPEYYYQYAPGYVYQVNRSTSVIEALIPLLAGGYMPGSYLPSSYMNSYVPDNYGYDSFYPSSYGADYGSGYGSDYGYGGDYANLCNRYAYGVVYQVDCDTGMVENVIPTYAGGYGVGQMLPSAYSYYNVPMQYRSIYYPTSDYSYWYAPGAIYQYDPSTSLITSVAALMSPGFSIGQPLPAGYGMYNVPMAYRSTYYDTPNAWYRYNNGYIYQVDPTTQLVTAIVASLLTSASANL